MKTVSVFHLESIEIDFGRSTSKYLLNSIECNFRVSFHVMIHFLSNVHSTILNGVVEFPIYREFLAKSTTDAMELDLI